MSLTAPLQANQPEFDFEIESQAGTLLVLKFQAREALSRLYEVRLEVAAAHDVDVDVAETRVSVIVGARGLGRP